jgi:hypothetical protein
MYDLESPLKKNLRRVAALGVGASFFGGKFLLDSYGSQAVFLSAIVATVVGLTALLGSLYLLSGLSEKLYVAPERLEITRRVNGKSRPVASWPKSDVLEIGLEQGMLAADALSNNEVIQRAVDSEFISPVIVAAQEKNLQLTYRVQLLLRGGRVLDINSDGFQQSQEIAAKLQAETGGRLRTDLPPGLLVATTRNGVPTFRARNALDSLAETLFFATIAVAVFIFCLGWNNFKFGLLGHY